MEIGSDSSAFGVSLGDVLASRIDITHEHIRHQFQLLVGWFSFFVTVNYASMGWLATTGNKSLQKELALALSLLFISQNLLGMLITIRVLASLRRSTESLVKYESLRANPALADLRFDTCVPLRVYESAVRLMNTAMVFITFTWAYFLQAYGILSFRLPWNP